MPNLLSLRPQFDSRLPPLAGYFVRFLVAYSVGSCMVELQWSPAEHSRAGHPFWLWNERVAATLFTIEYLVRIADAKDRRGYLTSGFGVIDLLSVLPFWVGFALPGRPTIYLRLVRSCRVLRLLKLVRYMPRVQLLLRALFSCWRELGAVCFLCFVVFLFGSIAVWEVERYGQPDKFDTLGDAMWWMFVTLTTVGYGDMSPVSALGKVIAFGVMMVGIGLVAGYIGIIANVVFKVFEPRIVLPEELRSPARSARDDGGGSGR